MRRTRRIWSSFFAAGLCGCLASSAHAVVTADNPNSSSNGNTSAPAGIAGWNNVGTTDGSSAVYIGNGWIMTPYHVGIGPTFTTSAGQPYSTAGGNGAFRLTDPTTNQPADVILFQLPGNSSNWPALPTLNLSYSAQTPSNNAYYNVGYGAVRTTPVQYYDASFNPTSAGSAVYGGFGYSPAGGLIEGWGRNYVAQGSTSIHVTGVGGSPDYGYITAFAGSFYNNLTDYQANGATKLGDQLVSGDSGGGVFNSQNELIGMMNAEGTYDDQPAYTALFGNGSYMADISAYYSQIHAISGIPEPSAICAMLGAVPLLLRRRRPMTGLPPLAD